MVFIFASFYLFFHSVVFISVEWTFDDPLLSCWKGVICWANLKHVLWFTISIWVTIDYHLLAWTSWRVRYSTPCMYRTSLPLATIYSCTYSIYTCMHQTVHCRCRWQRFNDCTYFFRFTEHADQGMQMQLACIRECVWSMQKICSPNFFLAFTFILVIDTSITILCVGFMCLT